MKKITACFAAVLLAFCVCLAPARAYADGEIAKVTVRTEPSNPGVMMKIADIAVSVSSQNANLESVGWYDSAGNLDTDTVDNCVYTLRVRVSAPAGYIFAETVEGAINNSLCTVERASDGSYLDLSRIIEPALVAPTVWWSPKEETVDIGGLASFAATASPYYNEIKWNLISPEGVTTGISTLESKFPGVTYTQDDSIGRLNIHNVPAAMDGWKVSCTFTGPGGSATTNAAGIKVKVAATPAPTPTATPMPTATPAPDPGGGSDTPTADSHQHEYSNVWTADDAGHWHACSCGDKADYAAHSYEWTTTAEATKKHDGEEKGVCSVCGFETMRAVAYEKVDSGSPNLLLIILLVIAGVVVLALILMIVQSVSDRKRRKRRKNRKR